ncbi:MAG: trimethylamine methyltransferase family protein [Rhodobacteraceae bacterium]|nr:trimethylamine methyltransferase family protein [Paracoccaceae bacterium]
MQVPRRRGRAAQSSARSAAARIPQAPRGGPRHCTAPLSFVAPEALVQIHEASLTILEEIGMDFLSPRARAMAISAGATAGPEPERLRFDRGLVTEMVAKAPARFVLRAGDPLKNLPIGEGFTHWGCVSSAPQVNDLSGGRRPGSQEDFRRFVKLGHGLNVIGFFGGYPVEPQDLPPATRHLDCISDFLTLTDKVFHPYCLGATRIRDALDLIRLARGLTEDELREGPQCYTVVNSSSPLRYDAPMLDGLIEMALANQCVCFTPFTLAGAMAPITLAGALAQQNAETLAGIAFAQMVRPGAPVIYGAYTSNVDMRTGAPAMGTPEYFKAAVISGQLARFYGVPYRSSGGNAANAPDAQAVYETTFALWGAKLGQADIVMHSAGWLEGGLSASPEKLVIDAEILQGIDAAFAPVAVDDESLGLDAIREVGPGGHFFGAAHTMARYTSEFYSPLLSDWSNFGAWTAAGSRETLARAHDLMKALLDAYEPPALEPARAEAMAAHVARRKAEGGALDA